MSLEGSFDGMSAAEIVAEMTAAPEWATSKVSLTHHAWQRAVQSVQPGRYPPIPGTTRKWLTVLVALVEAADNPHLPLWDYQKEMCRRYGVAVEPEA